MSQTTEIQIQNQAGLPFRQKMNLMLSALNTCFAGTTEPTVTEAYMNWLDTSVTPNVLKRRNAGDTAFEVHPLQSLADSTKITADASMPRAGGNYTGPANANKGVDIASAATTNIASATGEYVTVTGTTTITALGTAQAGTMREVRFSEALTLTHNATSLILPTSANILTASGDVATFRSEGSGNWRCVHYQRADGSSLVSSGTSGFPTSSRLYATATGLDSNVFVSSAYVVVQNGSGQTKVLTNFQQTINLATSGAGGLDTGTVATSSWYGIWALTKDDGTQSATAALCKVLTGNTTGGSAVVTSISSTTNLVVGMPIFSVNFPVGTVIKSIDSGTQVTMSRNALATTTGVNITYVYNPVMPETYTHKGLITCAIRTDGTANKYPQAFTKLGRRVSPKVGAGTNVTGLPQLAAGVQGSPTTPTWAAISLANYVSPLAVEVTLGLGANAVAGNIQILAPNNGYGNNASSANRPPVIYETSTSGTTGGGAQGRVLLESGNIYYAANASNSWLFLEGYEEII